MAQSPRRFPQGFIMPHLPHRGEQARAPRRICRLRRQTGSGTSRRIFCPTGRKQTLRTTIDAKTYIIVKPRRVSRRARREKILIINRRDMRVAIYSSRAAVHRRGITIGAPFRARQSCQFLETGSLHPPPAALRRFPCAPAARALQRSASPSKKEDGEGPLLVRQ